MSLSLLLLVVGLTSAAPTPSAEIAEAGVPVSARAVAVLTPREEEVESLLRIGEQKLAANDSNSALLAFRQAIRLADGEARARAMLGMARAHRRAGEGVKAVATYERLIQDHGDWQGVPLALLELGRVLRENGAPRLAISRFYSVIHGTLKLPEANADLYRQLVRTAQFEIAETHLALGEPGEAARLFQRLDLLDLVPEDRSRARLRTAQAQLLNGDPDGAVVTLTRLIQQDTTTVHAAEARFLLARLHAEAGRIDEAQRVALDLLRAAYSGLDYESWRAWQRRAGEFLAARFRDSGDNVSALRLYRALDALDNSPDWRAPHLYQIGLALERERRAIEARETYAELARVAALPGAGDEARELAAQGRWRSEQLEWAARVEAALAATETGLAARSSTKAFPNPDSTNNGDSEILLQP